MKMEAEGTRMDRRRLGDVARLLSLIAIPVNLAGMAVLGFTVFAVGVNLMMGGLPFGEFPFGFFFDGYMIVGMSMAFTPLLKFFPGVMMPIIGQAVLRAERRRPGAWIFLISGGLTIPPIIIGGSLLLDPLLATFGVLPLLPHVAGGALLVAAGVLTFLWSPPPVSTATTFVSLAAQPSITIGTQPRIREVVLVICPYCGTKNPQGTTRCSNCSGKL